MADTATPGSEPKRRRRWWVALLGTLAILLLVTVLATTLFLRSSVRRAFPDVDGELVVAGLDGEVEVIRDTMGVPHIYADTPHDLFMAQGFVHAQERFWQMDVWRHVGSGRLAEMFGESQVETDAFIRTLGWPAAAASQYEASTPEMRGVLEAYAAGVNAYLATQSPADLSFEYTVLELLNHSYEPEPWAPTDTLTWGLAMAWDLRGNMDNEIQRAMMLGFLPEEQVAQLWPPYPGEIHPYIVPTDENRAASPVEASLHAVPGIRTALESAADKLDLVVALGAGIADSGIGSNSWVVSGALTDTGAPILANDPHLGIQMPSIWYQAGLHCRIVSDLCAYDVAGFSFAGVPGIIVGHNADIAWGVTNLGPDVQDLYIEKLNPADQNQYEVNGAWAGMDVREETIDVAGGEPVTVTVRATRHGPVVSDALESLEDFDRSGVEKPDPYAIALRWTALDANPGIVTAFLGLDTASNWDEFREALSTFTVPAQNFIYADTAGNIGYQAPGSIPIRAGGDGTLPVPGWTDEYEWTGFIPFDELPRSFNPERGYIVTANNAVVDDSYRYHLTYDWAYGYRARRLVDLVGSNPGIGLDEHRTIQFDAYDLNAERLMPYLTRLDSPLSAPLASWDFANFADSPGAAAFNAVWARVLELTFHDDLPEDFWPDGGGRWFSIVSAMLDEPKDPFWDDTRTAEVEGRDDILTRALDAAYDDLVDRFGDDPANWRWGEMHTSTFVSQTLGATGIGLIDDRFNRGPYPSSGGAAIVNATSWSAVDGFATTWLPSFRMLVDLGDLSRSLATHTTGQSGHTDHPHYDDMIPLWLSGENAPMLWTRAQVDEAAETVQTLIPEE
jgi:penicillin amidase